MDLEFFQNYIVVAVLGICLCVGYVIKASLSFVPNKFIPLIMLILGTLINVIINVAISADIVLAGMISGLASTGLHETLRNMIEKRKDT